MAKLGGMLFGGALALVASVTLAGAARLRHAPDASEAAPRISVQYRQALAKLPDWNGVWEMTGGAKYRTEADV